MTMGQTPNPSRDQMRRVSLGIEPEAFAAEAGISVAELGDYERRTHGEDFDIEVARLIGIALDRLEQSPPAQSDVLEDGER